MPNPTYLVAGQAGGEELVVRLMVQQLVCHNISRMAAIIRIYSLIIIHVNDSSYKGEGCNLVIPGICN